MVDMTQVMMLTLPFLLINWRIAACDAMQNAGYVIYFTFMAMKKKNPKQSLLTNRE
jgi:hypothetical protein